MNKKSFLILAIVAVLLLPMGARAATEFSLGGFIKLDVFWDSTQENKNMNSVIGRNNNVTVAPGAVGAAGALTQNNFHHGRLKFTSQGSRFNFTIKGPELWGAKTTAFIEMDFDQGNEVGLAVPPGATGAATSASNNYTPRMRHAMFRLNWPGTELLFGQYWSLFSQWFPETTQDGAFQITGTPTARLPQIRLTQQFLGAWKVSALVGEANGITNGQAYSVNDRLGAESAEAPQVQAQVEFAQDLWGKAAWYGKPTPFTVQLTGGWQRGVIEDTTRALLVTSQNNYETIGAQTRHQYLDPWAIMGTMFIPVIPTYSANLAGTASLQTSWWVGQGVEAFGWIGFGSQVFRFDGVDSAQRNVYDVDLMKRFGGQVQGQYYFNNQWFLTAAYGMSRAFDVGAHETNGFAGVNNRTTAFAADTAYLHQEYNLCLWYRPITALKFGLQYAYNRTNFIQRVQNPTNSNITDLGEAHRVEFVGLFFF